VKDRPHVPDPLESAAGEEDPGASLSDPATREAMREESRAAGDDSAARQAGQSEQEQSQREQSKTALENVREGYRGGGSRR